MTIYTPDKWILIKISGDSPHYRVFGSWYGGYLGADSWRMNSGITKCSFDGENYIFEGSSGSKYVCYKDAYGASMYGWSVIGSFEKRDERIKSMEFPETILDIDWTCKDV